MSLPLWRWIKPAGLRNQSLRRIRLYLEALEERNLLSLGAPVLYTASPTPNAIVAADVTGDGAQDLVTVGGQTQGAITVLVNNGHGVFNDPAFPSKTTTVPNTFTFQKVAVGDFNGDGKMDVAAIGIGVFSTSPELFVLFGKGDGTFDTTRANVGVYFVGTNPDAVIATGLSADFTQEDLIVHGGTGDANALTVLVNKHDHSGKLNVPVVYKLLGGAPGPIAVGDFVSSGGIDVAVAQRNFLFVLKGDGTGALSAPITNTLTTIPSALAAGVFTNNAMGDGLAVASADGNVVLLESDGNGDFTQAGSGSPVNTGLTALNSIVVGDFTDHGKSDVAVAGAASGGGAVEVLRSDGFGHLAKDSTAAYGVGPISLAAADLNGDGFPDIAASDGNPSAPTSTNDVAVFLTQQVVAHLTITGTPASVAAGQAFTFTLTAQDFLGAPVKGYTGTVHFQASDGDNAGLPADYTFQATDNGAHTFTATLNSAGTGIVITVSDTVTTALTGTSQPITVNAAPAVTHLVITAPASVSAGSPFSFTLTAEDAQGNVAPGYSNTVHFTSSDPAAVLPADFRFTGANQGTATFTATLNTPTTGAGALITATDTALATIMGTSPPIAVSAPAPEALPPIGPAVAIAPFFSGSQEPVVTSIVGNSVSVTASHTTTTGKGNSTPAGRSITSASTGSKPTAVATGLLASTVNGPLAPTTDQFAAVANAGDNSVSIVAPNDGKGSATLDKGQTLANVGHQPRALAVGDFNHQGVDELAVANFGAGESDPGSVAFLFQTGRFSFAPGQILTAGVNKPDAVAAGDFDGDGRKDDIAVANTGDGSVSIFTNRSGQYQLAHQYFGLPNPTALAVGDFDADGHNDLAVTTAGDSSVRILYGDGTGNFSPSAPIAVGSQPSSLAARDLAGIGGPPDLVVGNFGDSTVSVLINDGNRANQFQPVQTYQLHANAHPSSVALGNLSSANPAFPDVVTANADGTTSYLLNQGAAKPDAFLSEAASAKKLGVS